MDWLVTSPLKRKSEQRHRSDEFWKKLHAYQAAVKKDMGLRYRWIVNRGWRWQQMEDWELDLCIEKAWQVMDACDLPLDYCLYHDNYPMLNNRCKVIPPFQLPPSPAQCTYCCWMLSIDMFSHLDQLLSKLMQAMYFDREIVRIMMDFLFGERNWRQESLLV